ncbi:GNAT family N-acetyltransferase [Streptomyces sannanensis]
MVTTLIDRASAQDAEALTALVQASRAYEGRYAPMVAGYRVTADSIERHPVYKAADPAGRVLGFYVLLLDDAELDPAFVADEAQGLGIGRLLMEHMFGHAGEAGLPHVRVVSHPPAEKFYRRTGARRTGTVAPVPPKVTWERPEPRFEL